MSDGVNIRSDFVHYQRWGLTHIMVDVHFRSANLLTPEQFAAVQQLVLACRRLDELCPRSLTLDPSWTARGDPGVIDA